MTSPAREIATWTPGPWSLVLANRRLRPGDTTKPSVFRDNRWNLSPAVFESNSQALSINFDLVPSRYVAFTKRYAWLELNYDGPSVILRRASINGRLSVRTVVAQIRQLRVFLEWLDEQDIAALADVGEEGLTDYLGAVRRAELGHGHKCDLLQAVRRVWAFRDQLPQAWRLPESPCWGGRDSRELLGRSARDVENRTPRIPEAPMTVLLKWALRFVEDFSGDIVSALDEFRPMFGWHPGRGRAAPDSRRARKPGQGGLRAELEALLADMRANGESLPGRLQPGGARELDWYHLARLVDCNYQNLQAYEHTILQSGLPIADAAYLRVLPVGLLDGTAWTSRIAFPQVKPLVRHLATACLIVISYLSGMRPGEVLTLERGCLERDERTGLLLVRARYWKGAVDENGEKLPEGEIRPDPWVVVEPVARAIAVLERLHNGQALFPTWILDDGAKGTAAAKTYGAANQDLNKFVGWVNEYCRLVGRDDVIGADIGRLNLSRFRRTLAWFICRRPRGLVAAAIQYGHVRVQITQGYGGSYASGFPDELAFENWLSRLDELDEADRRLRNGEHVSGPAAGEYQRRVTGGAGRFAGHVIVTKRQARMITANPSLQIHPGRGMTCVFNAATALCQLMPAGEDPTRTPDLDDCRSNCTNIARTDADIAALRGEISELAEIVAEDASPPIRLARERARLAELQHIVDVHEASRKRGHG